MSDITANYGLIKPLQEEFYNVGVPNSNMDAIDALLKGLSNQAADKVGKEDIIDVAHGGTGATSLADVTVGNANKLGDIAADSYPTTEWVNAQLSNKANTSVRFQGDVTDFINVPSGFYQAGPDVTGMPGIGWWNVLVVSSGAASRSITAYDSITPITNHTFILNVVNEQMGKWVQLATAEPPQRFAISFASGWLNTTDSYFYKNQFGEVTIRAESTKDSAVDPLGTLFVLPEGYRPPRIIQFAITFSSPFATVIVMVEPNGRVSTRSGVTEAVRGYFMNITFAI